MRFFRLMLFTAALAGCQRSNADTVLTCSDTIVCAYIHVSGNRLSLGIINDSEDPIYIPWINGAASLTSGFVLKEAAIETSTLRAGSPSPTAIPLIGNALLVPHSSYGVSVTKKDAKEIFQLRTGCQTVVAEFRALAAENDQGKLVTSAISKPTRICLE